MTAGKVDCSAVVGGLRASFNSGRTRGATARRVALTHLLEMLDTEEDAIVKALAEDLNKPPFEAVLMEMDVVRSYAVKKELKQALFLCVPFFSKKENVHLFSSSLPHFDQMP